MKRKNIVIATLLLTMFMSALGTAIMFWSEVRRHRSIEARQVHMAQCEAWNNLEHLASGLTPYKEYIDGYDSGVMRDPWGGEYRYEDGPGGDLACMSNGPDGAVNSGDDIIVEMSALTSIVPRSSLKSVYAGLARPAPFGARIMRSNITMKEIMGKIVSSKGLYAPPADAETDAWGHVIVVDVIVAERRAMVISRGADGVWSTGDEVVAFGTW